MDSTSATTTYRRKTVDGVGIFYREAGPKTAPAIVLLHGFPSVPTLPMRIGGRACTRVEFSMAKSLASYPWSSP